MIELLGALKPAVPHRRAAVARGTKGGRLCHTVPVSFREGVPGWVRGRFFGLNPGEAILN